MNNNTDTSIIKWHEEGRQQGFGFMLVCRDFDGPRDFVEYLSVDEDPVNRVQEYRREQVFRNIEVIGCYSLRLPIEDQMASAWNFELA